MIGKILKRMRAQKKLKQRELSKIINIPQNTISQYETETIQPTFEIIEKIASACGYQVEFKSDKEVLTSENIKRMDIE
ncbi:MAG: helix-turn-helix transcriptional regulator [Bacilli bacterium]|nr:helix-turn-helix transcriptional regulator [Bacilli bacterium]